MKLEGSGDGSVRNRDMLDDRQDVGDVDGKRGRRFSPCKEQQDICTLQVVSA